MIQELSFLDALYGLIAILIGYLPLIMALPLKGSEQPELLRGSVTESATNTFTASEISVPRILSTRELFDADLIELFADIPERTTSGLARTQVQLQLSDDEPTVIMNADDPKLLANLLVEAVHVLLESAAGVFTVQRIAPTGTLPFLNGRVDSTRWRNIFPDDKVWLCIHSIAVTNISIGRVRILGKLDRISSEDFGALVLSRL